MVRPRPHPTQKRLNLAYMHLLDPLRKKLTPRGVELSDSQLIDTCVATVHGLLLEEGVEPKRRSRPDDGAHKQTVPLQPVR